MSADLDYEEDDDIPEILDRPIIRYIGVAAFTVGLDNKRYGGPEEGGWWYDTFAPIRVFCVPQRLADRCYHRLERWCKRMNEQEGRYPPSSVLCRGWWAVQREIVTTDQPEGRQGYS